VRVTQSDIAAATGLDVSSVNKILNEVEGPMFRESTKREVFRVARRLGWKPLKTNLAMKTQVLRDVRDVFRKSGTAREKLCRIWALLGRVS
jgi:DNA-binding LacI/PurR family transcriptional regulator